MAFAYRELTVSGNVAGTEGSSKLIQEIKDTLVNSMGWTLTEDRSTQPGTSHIVTFQSNGEPNTFSTYYLILTSGTGASAATGQDVINLRAGTAWSTVTHAIASSGTGTPLVSGTITLGTDSNGVFTAWISGDKDAVTFITRVGNTYDGAHVGRIAQFTSSAFDRFPIYVVGDNSSSVDAISNNTSNVYTFLSSTAATNIVEADWESFYNIPLDLSQHPNNIFGSTEAYVAFPMVASISDNSPINRSVRGFSINIWSTIASGGSGQAPTIDPEDELTASDGKVYKVFFDTISSTRAVVIRKV